MPADAPLPEAILLLRPARGIRVAAVSNDLFRSL